MSIPIIEIIAGVVLILAAVGAMILAICRTPDHLRGYYGAMYALLLNIALAGGTLLTLVGIRGLVA